MAIILNIDTAVQTASVCLAENAGVIQFKINQKQQDQASWLHIAVKDIVNKAGLQLHDIEAVGVTIGPGSYTGLRVGLSAAKGLCYGLNIPLITINTLLVMAYAVKDEDTDWICPLIDARRMEVFTAVYDRRIDEVMEPAAMIVDNNSFHKWLSAGKVLFTGNGNKKLKEVIDHPNAVFNDTEANAITMSEISEQYFNQNKWSELAYTEPFYLKDFYNPAH